jgi:hypothetical protein
MRTSLISAVLACLALAGCQPEPNVPQFTASVAAKPAKAANPNGSISEAERNYLGAAGSYLMEGNEQGTVVAKAMAGASNGSSTLPEIRDAISSAKHIENVGYLGDYKARINGNIPRTQTKVAADIDETHRLFQASMDEFLEYWKDQNLAHLDSGGATFKRCVLLMNATIKHLGPAIQKKNGKG